MVTVEAGTGLIGNNRDVYRSQCGNRDRYRSVVTGQTATGQCGNS